MPDPGYDPETLLIGVMGRPHGLRGEMVLRPHNATSSDLARVRVLIFERPGAKREERRIESIRRAGDGWLLRLDGVLTRDQADTFTNLPVRVRRAALPAPTEGEFFVDDTIGCEVFTEEGVRLGAVEELFWNGAQDVWVVRGGDREAETMIPVVPHYVRSADTVARRIVVTWPEDADEPSPKDEHD